VIHITLTKTFYAASTSAYRKATSPSPPPQVTMGDQIFAVMLQKYLPFVAPVFIRDQQIQTTQQKKQQWELGQKSLSADNFMGSLRNFTEVWGSLDNSMRCLGNCTPHTCYYYRSQGNDGTREGMNEKNQSQNIPHPITHMDPSSKKGDEQERTVSFLHSLRGRAWKEKERPPSNWL